MGDDITIGVTEIVNNIEVTAQPNDQIVDISVIDNADDVTLNITPTVIEINVNRGSSFAKWGTILGTLSDQTDLQDALDLKADLVDGKVPSSQLPSYVDDVIEVANYAALPATGETGKIYVTIDNNKIFRWTGSTYVEIIDSAAVWGAITGTLSSQTDLQNALNLKANDNAVVKLTGDQSITGSKSFTTNTAAPAMVVTNNSTDNGILLQNTSTGRGITSNNVSTGIGIRSDNTGGGTGISSSNTGAGTGIVSTNTSTTGSALSISNSSTGYGILLTNSTGTGISSSNTGSGTGFYSNNSSTGNGIQSINSSSGYGISSSNTGSGRGIYSSNNSTGDAINIANSGSGRGIYLTNASTGNSLILNNGTSATGMPFTVSKNGTDKFTINDAGEATGVKFIKSGGTSSQFLKADGSVDSTTYQTALTNPVTGTGTTNYIPKFTGASAIGNSLIYDNGTNIEIGGGIITNKSGGTFWQSKNGATNYFIIGNDSTIAGGSVSDINYYAYLGNQIFSTGGSERMRLTTNGELLIGRTTSYGAGWQLAVEGNIYAKNDLRIDANASFGGNVGIGTSSPSALLDINGTSTVQQNLSIANDRQFSLYSDGTRMIINSVKNVPLAIYTNDTERMRITSGGSVGIGTTSPSSLLHLYVPTGTLYQTLESNVINQTVGTITKTPSKSFFTGQNYSVVNNWEVYDITSSASRLSISPSGNVGIGTPSPTDGKLQVAGNTQLGNTIAQTYFGVGAAATKVTSNGSWAIGVDAADGSTERMRITSGGNVYVNATSGLYSAFGYAFGVKAASGNQTYLSIATPSQTLDSEGLVIGVNADDASIILRDNKPLDFWTNNTNRMRITSGGDVLVGTTNSSYTSSGRGVVTVSGSNQAIYGLAINGIGKGYLYHTGTDVYIENSVVGGVLYMVSGGSNGVYLASGATSWTANSDNRLKDINYTIENAVDKLCTLNAVSFSWKTDKSKKEILGLIAQDVEKVFPQIIDKNKLSRSVEDESEIDETEYLGVRYQELIPVLVKAIQELKAEIEILKNK